nr:hypothetical protein [Nocardia abscessus]
MAGVGPRDGDAELSFDEGQGGVAYPVSADPERRRPREEMSEPREQVVQPSSPCWSSVSVAKDSAAGLRSAAGFDVIEDALHQSGGDGLPSCRASLLVESHQAVCGVEVVDGEAEQTATAAGGFDEQPQHQRVEWTVVSCRRGDASEVVDLLERQCVP